MSDVQALYHFLRRPVSPDMIQCLVNTTNSVIAVPDYSRSSLPSPPASPLEKPVPSLYCFIEALIDHSHVQTPTLMSSLVYLIRLREILPPNSTGMETTRHRIFLGCLILAAKNLNDSSPLNKHWCKYTNGLLSLRDVNTLEMELIGYLGWDNIRIRQSDLISTFSPFLEPIKSKLRRQSEAKIAKHRDLTRDLTKSHLSSSLPSPTQPLYAHWTKVPSFSHMPSPSPQRPKMAIKRTSGSTNLNAKYSAYNLQKPYSFQSLPTTASIPSLSTSSSIPSLASTNSTSSTLYPVDDFNPKPLRLPNSHSRDLDENKENHIMGPYLRVINPDMMHSIH
ncbi:hypothetical protein KL905_002959 [Ogataea polymorpha]|nr:hypothetical protein KL937_002517 [Ogataea polymorpha]KAG7888938.1 hypothetical protein KL936_003325 [Ogataea polymorpha]KAG7900817.1 hypothetical protein KL935_002750 [Ogataea polymorpha]KAG7904868.1 hypothetical protein KL907_003084 [Ogataea polymorpha]KAG7908011.1 hypothetical protein KL906_003428 [Ogataea polymorpha]